MRGLFALTFTCLLASCGTPPDESLDVVPRLVKSEGPLLAGAARIDITPDRPIPLAGYGARLGRPLEGVHDRVYVRALVLECGDVRVGVLSCDLLLITRALLRHLQDACTSLDLDSIFWSATHNHSGPGGYWDNLLAEAVAIGPYVPEQPRSLVRAAHRALEQADANLGPARVGRATVDAGRYVKNRRIDGGKRDPDLTLVHFERPDGEALAAIVYYSAHPTILSEDNMLVSADFPGFLGRHLEDLGYRAALFLNGSAGEARTTWPGEERGFDRAKALGETLGQMALQARDNIELRDQVTLVAADQLVRLPRISTDGPLPRGIGWILQPWVRPFCPKDTWLSLFGIGDWRFVSIPCDTGIGTVERIREGSAALDVYPVSFAQDYIGYVTDSDSFDRGTYESRLSFYGRDLSLWLERQACHLLEVSR